jgi:hypothetical protein
MSGTPMIADAAPMAADNPKRMTATSIPALLVMCTKNPIEFIGDHRRIHRRSSGFSG